MKFYFIIFLAVYFLLSGNAFAVIKITPQFVVNKVLTDGRDVKNIDYEARKADLPLSQARAIYDWQLTSKVSYELSRFESMLGPTNLQDRTTVWNAAMTKKIPTGTTFTLAYTRTFLDTIFNPSSTVTRPSFEVGDEVNFTLKQELSGNFFGIVDRYNEKVALQNTYVAALNKKESQQDLVLQSIRLFWQTFIAKESLRDAIAAREKYNTLVVRLTGKSQSGFANPGDLAQAKAQYQAQESSVKEASYSYLSSLQKLFVAMRMNESAQETILDIPEEIPSMPAFSEADISGIRKVKSAQVTYENAEIEYRASKLAGLPELNLVGKANYNGIDRQQDRSFADMTSGYHPKYYIGLELSYRLDSDLIRGQQAYKTVAYEQAQNNLLKIKEEQENTIFTTAQKVRSSYGSAISATEAAKYWEQAVREMEVSYRQGRIDTSAIIQAYGNYYRALSVKTKAIGDYQISLNEYAAIKNKLVE